MQKQLALFVAIILLVTPVLALNVRPTKSAGGSTSNPIIQNGGFEEGLTGWTSGGDGLLAVSGNNPRSGNCSLEISSSVSQQAYFYQYLDCPNASFVYSFWIFRVDPISWTACYMGRNWDGNTIRVVSSLVIDDDKIELNAWDYPGAPGRQMFNYNVTVGSWHKMTFFANATQGTQDFYVDGNLVQTLNSSSGDVFSPDVLIFGDVNTVDCHGHFYFDDLELSSVDGNSIIQNGGFEEGLTGWSIVADGFLAVSSENAHSGNNSLEIASSVSQQAAFYQYLDCPNASFVFSFWIFRVDPISETHCYLNREWDGNTARVVSSVVIKDDTIGLQAWDDPYAVGRQTFNYTVTVGVWHNVTFAANATLGIQDFYIDGNLIQTLNSSSGYVFNPDDLIFGDVSNGACNGTFYFDDLELRALDDSGNPIERARLQVVNPITGDGVFNFTDKKVGDTFLANVTVANVQRMVCWQFALQWDASLLECVDATIPSDNVFAYWNVSGEPIIVADPDLSHRGLVFYGAQITYPDRIGFNGSGVLAQVEFKILNKVGQSDLSFVGIGIDTFLLSDDLSDIWFMPISAQYSFSGSSIPGDVNMDGTVNMRDIQRMILLFNTNRSSPSWDPNADVNNDGTVNMRDIAIALTHFNQHA